MYYAKLGIIFGIGFGVGVLGTKLYYDKKLNKIGEMVDEIQGHVKTLQDIGEERAALNAEIEKAISSYSPTEDSDDEEEDDEE